MLIALSKKWTNRWCVQVSLNRKRTFCGQKNRPKDVAKTILFAKRNCFEGGAVDGYKIKKYRV